ncbi:FAD-dependent oxidoreductase [bacterium]|nr:FAD-dependent oxidoreductase [bacterium]
MKNDFDILVIGAGISGLASARALQDQGFSVAILEKSRGLGGRMATRRDENGLWDHGVPWLWIMGSRGSVVIKRCSS